MELDRFSTKNDPQEKRVHYYCDISGNEIFEGESYLETTEGDILEDTFEALINFYNVQRKWAGEDII